MKLRENADFDVVTGVSDIIIDSINKKWDNIRDFNSIIVNLNEEGYEDMVPVIQSILDDETKNVGKLQQLVELISPGESSIDEGRQEAIDELDGNIEVQEEMKLKEGYDNLPKDTQTCVTPAMGKAIEDKGEIEKEVEAALKENEKLAQETIPEEGETGKKVTSKELKAMHLSESLFDELDEIIDEEETEELNEEAEVKSKLPSRLQNAFERVEDYIYVYLSEFESSALMVPEVENIIRQYDGEWYGDDDVALQNNYEKCREAYVDSLMELYFANAPLEEGITLGESLKPADAKVVKNTAVKLVREFAKEKGVEISEEDMKKFLKWGFEKIEKASEHEKISNNELIDMLKKLAMHFFNREGRPSLVEESLKMDIAKEQLKRFKEGKMPRDFEPKDYIKELVSKNHLTKEEGEELLAEDYGANLTSREGIAKELERCANELIWARNRMVKEDSFDVAAAMVDSLMYDLRELDKAMQNYEEE